MSPTDTQPLATHIMLDFETMSLQPNAAIVQVGAVVMTEALEAPNTFNGRIDPRQISQLKYHVDPATMAWWNEQEAEVRNYVFGGKDDALIVARDFLRWCRNISPHQDFTKLYIWVNHAQADGCWLQNWLEQEVGEYPFYYKNLVDYSAIKFLFPDVPKPADLGVNAHNALSDAIWQARHAMNIIQHIRENKAKINDVLQSIS